jgi:hypothetical protein
MRDADTLLSLGRGMSPCRSSRELLLDVVLILPGGEAVIEAGPLDEKLSNHVGVAWMEPALQHAFWNLKAILEVWERRHGRSTACRRRRRSRLKEGHVEYRVNGGALRKKQLVGDFADLVDDLERTEELEAELLMSARGQQGLHIRLQAKVDEVADIELALGPSLVSLCLHVLLGAK